MFHISDREKLTLLAHLGTQGAWAGPAWYGDVLLALRTKLGLPALMERIAAAPITPEQIDGTPQPHDLSALEGEVLVQAVKTVMHRFDTPPQMVALCLAILDRAEVVLPSRPDAGEIHVGKMVVTAMAPTDPAPQA